MTEKRDHPQHDYPPMSRFPFLALLDYPGRPLTDQEQAEIDRISAETEALLQEVEAILAEGDADFRL